MAPTHKRRKLNTPLHRKACLGTEKDVEALQKAIQLNPAAVNTAYRGFMPLISAIRAGHCRCVEMLIRAGADLDVCKQKWLTPLTCAIDEGSEEVLQLLLRAGANVNPSQITVSHPLYVAVGFKNNDFVELLIQFGANPHIKVFNKSFMKFAIANGCSDIIRTLLKHGVSIIDYQNSERNELLLLISMSIIRNDVDCIKAMFLHDAMNIINKIIKKYKRSGTCKVLNYLTFMIVSDDYVTERREDLVNILYQFGFNFWTYEANNENGYDKIDVHGPGWETIEHIKQVRSQPLRLKALCRIAIQKYLGPRYLETIPKLELPRPLYSFLEHNDT